MEDARSFSRRWSQFQISKTMLFWSCLACIVVTLMIGFTWGGWVTGSTARTMSSTAAREGRAELAAAICVSRFMSGPDATAKLASLKADSSWKRNEALEQGGWATMAGSDKPVPGVALVCVERLLEPKPTATSG